MLLIFYHKGACSPSDVSGSQSCDESFLSRFLVLWNQCSVNPDKFFDSSLALSPDAS